MSVTSDKQAYKVTSLLIKAAILIFSFWYIIHKLNLADIRSVAFELETKADGKLIALACGFLFINWGIEALKWKLLIAPLERISFSLALRSVFAGVTVSIFMPNRIGEFAGRIFFLERADKVEATLKNFIGSAAQLAITVFAGLCALAALIRNGYWDSIVPGKFSLPGICLSLIAVAVILLLLVILYRRRSVLPVKIQSYFKVLSGVKREEIFLIVGLSAIRYFVFLLQYYIILRALGVMPDVELAFSLIALTFLITSVIPSFALTEVATRGVTAMYLFAGYTSNSASVITASLLVWIINLAIPAMIGSAFIWKLKFFKS